MPSPDPFPAGLRSGIRARRLILGSLIGGFLVAPTLASYESEKLLREAVEVKQHRALEGGHFNVEITSLPGNLLIPKGQVALLPDFEDVLEKSCAVYLVNEGDKPLDNAVFELNRCVLQVQIGNDWQICEAPYASCGTVGPPKPLAAGRALVFRGLIPSHQGDRFGKLRYVVLIRDRAPIASQPFMGFYSSAIVEANLSQRGWFLAETIRRKLKGEKVHQQSLSRNTEELLALVELERSWKMIPAVFPALEEWRDSQSPYAGGPRCSKAINELLTRSRDRDFREAGLFLACHRALSGSPTATYPFGSPERCRALVWRYLCGQPPIESNFATTPERWDEIQMILKSGNPWGVSKGRAASLVTLAVASLGTADPEERDAASRFLASDWISEDHISDNDCRGLLAKEQKEAKRAGFCLLARRGLGRESGEWLMQNQAAVGDELLEWWKLAADSAIGLQAWEVPLALDQLKRSRPKTLEFLNLRFLRSKQAHPASVEEAIRTPSLERPVSPAIQKPGAPPGR